MSAAALAQRLRAGAVSGPFEPERNGWNGWKTPVPFQEKQPVPELESNEKQQFTGCRIPLGTGGTDGTGVFKEVEVKCDESRPDQAANGAPEPAPAAADSIESAREQARMDWRQADLAYLNHHFGCPTCISAGKGYGKRCPTGLDLWNGYEAACDADRNNTINTRGRNSR